MPWGRRGGREGPRDRRREENAFYEAGPGGPGGKNMDLMGEKEDSGSGAAAEAGDGEGSGGPVAPRRRVHPGHEGNGPHVPGRGPGKAVRGGGAGAGVPDGAPDPLSGGAGGRLRGSAVSEGSRRGAGRARRPADGGWRERRRRPHRRGVHQGPGHGGGACCVSDAPVSYAGRPGHGKFPGQPRKGVEHPEKSFCLALLSAGPGPGNAAALRRPGPAGGF